MKFSCLFCNQKCKTSSGLTRHVSKKHNSYTQQCKSTVREDFPSVQVNRNQTSDESTSKSGNYQLDCNLNSSTSKPLDLTFPDHGHKRQWSSCTVARPKKYRRTVESDGSTDAGFSDSEMAVSDIEESDELQPDEVQNAATVGISPLIS